MAQKKKFKLSDYDGGGGKNKWLDKLYTELIKNDVSPKRMWEMLAETGISKDKFLERADRNSFAKTTKGQRPLRKYLLYQIFATFQFLNLGDFIITDNESDADKKNKKLFTSNDWNKIEPYKPDRNPLLNAFSFPKDNNNNKKIKKSYKKIAPYFRNAKKRILVFELTFKGSNTKPNQLTAYQIAQAKIYKAIEDALKFHDKEKKEKGKSDFKYIRVFSLSKSEKYFSKNIISVAL